MLVRQQVESDDGPGGTVHGVHQADGRHRAGLHAGFLAHAERQPHRPALTIGDRVWTYADAAHIVRQWASRLFDATGGRPRRVGVFAQRSETAYLGVLATLLSGAAFVPLNRRFPLERTRTMLRQADVDALFVDTESLPQLPALLEGLPRPPAILLPTADAGPVRDRTTSLVFGASELATAAPLTRFPTVGPEELAYLLFTSGSTGRPKGVPITHGNARAFLDVNRRRYDFGPEDRFSQTFDSTFDLSIFDLFMAWESGAAVCSMQPIELLAPFRFLREQQITVWFSVPSAAALLIKRGVLQPGTMPGLRWSLFCGEGLPRTTAEAWQAAAPRSTLENLYGPTELTIACAAYRWDPVASPARCKNDLVPIGEVYPGLSCRLVDAALVDVAPGQPGELCVAGPQTTAGYWRAPELDGARFFERVGPFGALTRYYRTGDIVVQAPGEPMAWLGRTDHQVKLGGYRIELGEVEAALRRAGCSEAAALAWPDAQRPEAIVAVVSGISDVPAVLRQLGESLPAWAVPKSIHVLPALPLNDNGKIDRGALRSHLVALSAAATELEGR